MASLQVSAIVDSNPDPVCFVLPHKDLERQIDCRFRRSLHYTSAGSRVAEEKQGGRPQFEAGTRRLLLLIDRDEQGELAPLDFGSKPGDRLGKSVSTRDRHDAAHILCGVSKADR